MELGTNLKPCSDELNSNYLEQLLSDTYPELLITRKIDFKSAFAVDQSVPLLTEIRGSIQYQESLHRLSSDLLGELIASGIKGESAIKRAFDDHARHLALILHTAAHVASRYPHLRAIAVSQRNESYTSGKRYGHLCRDRMRRLLAALSSDDRTNKVAHFDRFNGVFDRATGQGRLTRLVPREALLDRLVRSGLVFQGHPFDDRETWSPLSPIVMLDGVPIHRELQPQEKPIDTANQLLAECHFSLALPGMKAFREGYSFDDETHRTALFRTQLIRKFKHDDQTGGRLYGHSVQTVPSTLRKNLRVDGEPTCELDFRSMQLHIAYSLVQSTCAMGDPYSLPGSEGELDRERAKRCFVAGVGSGQSTNPVSAFARSCREHEGRWLPKGLAAKIDGEFWRVHASVRKFRGSSAWKQLQYEEGKIALDVIGTLASKGIACVPIFDSFIVKAIHEPDLRKAMESAVLGMSSRPAIIRRH